LRSTGEGIDIHARYQRRRRPAARLALALLGGLAVAAGLTGCGRPGAGPLATSAAERASWPRPPAGTVTVTVERVVDGDTFETSVAGRRESVRLIGVDTPETVAPGRPVEPYGPQASAFAKHWLAGYRLRLAGDAEPRDRYGRLLAYAWLGDGTFWNALLLAEGYAETLTIAPNDTFAGLFARLAAAARSAHRGLWANARAAAHDFSAQPESRQQATACRPGGPGSPPTTGPHAGRQGRRNANLLPAPPVSSRPRR
jgi:micrococcal nuclease